MGAVASHSTQAAVAPVATNWTRPTDPTGLLNDWQLAYLTAVPLLHRVGALDGVRSSWRSVNDGKTSAALDPTATGSLLRIDLDSSGAIVVSLGAPSPRCHFVPDWAMSAELDGRGGITVGTPYYRTLNDKLANKSAFTQIRNDLCDLYRRGPATLALSPGPPDIEPSILPTLLPPKSLFGGDLRVVQPAIRHGNQISFPADLIALIADKFATAGFPCPPPDGALLAIDVSYGSTIEATLSFHANQQVCWLEFRCETFDRLPATGQQRVGRHLLLALRTLTEMLSGTAAEAILRQHVDHLAAEGRNAEGSTHLEETWTATVPAPAVLLRAGQYFPVGIVITSPVPCTLSDLLIAERSLTTRRRGWAANILTKKSRANIDWSARRPAMFVAPDSPGPCIRYVHHGNPQIDTQAVVSGTETVFWQARLVTAAEAGGWHRSILWADTLSTAGGILAYGTELMTLMRTLSSGLEQRPNVRVDTFYVWA